VLVGLNAHLRNDPATTKHLKSQGVAFISAPQATELAKRTKAIKYVEHAQAEAGPGALFEDVVRAVVFPTTRLHKEMAKRERMLEKVRTEVAIAMAENRGELSFKKKGWDSTYIPKSFGKDMRDIRKLVLSSRPIPCTIPPTQLAHAVPWCRPPAALIARVHTQRCAALWSCRLWHMGDRMCVFTLNIRF
jgi:hypothetical protein